MNGVKVVMTQATFDKLVSTYHEDRERGDTPLCPKGGKWYFYVALNHWDALLPLEVVG